MIATYECACGRQSTLLVYEGARAKCECGVSVTVVRDPGGFALRAVRFKPITSMTITCEVGKAPKP